MTNTATTDHRGHGCPDDPTWDPDTQTFTAQPPAGTAGAEAVAGGFATVVETFTCTTCGQRERAGLNDGTDRCETCQDEAPGTVECPGCPKCHPRTPTIVRLEIALAQSIGHDTAALEAELKALETPGQTVQVVTTFTLRVKWEDDWEVDHLEEFDTYTEEPETCEQATVYGPDGEVLASLGCIDGATDEYRAQIERDLIEEALTAMGSRAIRVVGP